MYTVRVEGSFAAAHFLTHYHGKCERLHGHNYRVRAYARGPSLDEGGMLLDFGALKGALREVLAGLDHGLLNDVADFAGDPSAERIAAYIFRHLHERLPQAPLCAVEVFETDVNMARFEPAEGNGEAQV
jgi:6-pyruvoyltetrahydropterin/6-carboxytetrahydropterin synthase